MARTTKKATRIGFAADARRVGNRSIKYESSGRTTPTLGRGGRANPKLKRMDKE